MFLGFNLFLSLWDLRRLRKARLSRRWLEFFVEGLGRTGGRQKKLEEKAVEKWKVEVNRLEA